MSTGTGLFGIWDKKEFTDIRSGDDYRSIFIEDKTICARMSRGNCFFFSVGGDGAINFEITHFSQQKDKYIVLDEFIDVLIRTDSGGFFIGSPEFAGAEKQTIAQLLPVNLENGLYKLTLHHIYNEIKDDERILLNFEKSTHQNKPTHYDELPKFS